MKTSSDSLVVLLWFFFWGGGGEGTGIKHENNEHKKKLFGNKNLYSHFLVKLLQSVTVLLQSATE